MNYITFIYRGNTRELKKIISAILKSGAADNIKKFNYIQSYLLKEKKTEKIEEKLLFIHSKEQDKLLDFLSNFPQIEKINIT